MSEINYEEITDPMMLDSTGQGIITALTQIKNTVQPTNACIDIDISIAANVWPNSAPYEYTYLDSKITSGCSVKVDFLEGAQSAEVLYMRYSKVVGGVKFTAPVKPTTAIPVRLHLTGLDAESVTAITGSMVSTSSVPSKANVEEALTDHESRIGTLSNQIEKKYKAMQSGNILPLSFNRIGDFVFVSADYISPSSAISAHTWTTVGTVPDIAKPSGNRYIACVFMDDNADIKAGFRGRVNSNGTMEGYFSTSIATSVSLFMTGMVYEL